MNGNRLYPIPNEWETGETIDKIRMNRLEEAAQAIAQEIVEAAGNIGNDPATLLQRINQMYAQFIDKTEEVIVDCGTSTTNTFQ